MTSDVNILQTFNGAKAFDVAKTLMFPNSPIEAYMWALEWPEDEREVATVVIYSKSVKNVSIIGYEFRMGEKAFISEEREELVMLNLLSRVL